MRINLACHSMRDLTGSPLYHFELARALNKQGHQVAILSDWDPPIGQANLLKEILDKEGVACRYWYEQTPCDAVVASQGSEKVVNFYNKPTVNVSHSELPFEEPIKNPNVVAYVGIRDTIKEKWQKKYPGNWKVIGNPIDTERFNQKRKIPANRPFYLTLIPGTIDTLRQKFLKKMIAGANQYNRVIICGDNKGVELPESEWAVINPSTFYIDELIRRVDRVAGILLGRVNLEAAAMGVPSLIVDPDTLKEEEYPSGLDPKYDSNNVAKEIIKLVSNARKENRPRKESPRSREKLG